MKTFKQHIAENKLTAAMIKQIKKSAKGGKYDEYVQKVLKTSYNIQNIAKKHKVSPEEVEDAIIDALGQLSEQYNGGDILATGKGSHKYGKSQEEIFDDEQEKLEIEIGLKPANEARSTPAKKLIAIINKELPDAVAVPAEDFFINKSQGAGGIWFRGSEEYYDGSRIYNHPVLMKLLKKHGWQTQPYDAGTQMAWPG